MIPNTQPIEPSLSREDGYNLDVHSIFYTIQGEGPFAGRPAVFVRLAGCNLQCPGCDTDYTSKRVRISIGQIEDCIWQLLPTRNILRMHNFLVVITGGEPFRQNLVPLCDRLDLTFKVQIETNGVLEIPNLPKSVTVVCSPKTPRIHRNNEDRIDAFKYVVHHESINEVDGLPLHALGLENAKQIYRPESSRFLPGSGKIYLQPMDCKDPETNHKNLQAAMQSCMTFGYTLQLQIHKLIGVE